MHVKRAQVNAHERHDHGPNKVLCTCLEPGLLKKEGRNLASNMKPENTKPDKFSSYMSHSVIACATPPGCHQTPTNHILNDGGPRYKHASFGAGYSNQRPLPVPDEPYPPPSPQSKQPFLGGREMTFVTLEICVSKYFPIKGVATLEKYMVVLETWVLTSLCLSLSTDVSLWKGKCTKLI